jgi:hypothetical protein
MPLMGIEGFYATDKLLRRDLTGSHRSQTSILRKTAEKSYYVEFASTSKKTHVRWLAVIEVPNVWVRRKHPELINNSRRAEALFGRTDHFFLVVGIELRGYVPLGTLRGALA